MNLAWTWQQLIHDEIFLMRSFWPRIQQRRFTELFALSKVHLDAILGGNSYWTFSNKQNILSDAKYQSWMEEGQVKTCKHFNLHFPVVARLSQDISAVILSAKQERQQILILGKLNNFWQIIKLCSIYKNFEYQTNRRSKLSKWCPYWCLESAF